MTTVADAGTRPILTIDPSGNGGFGVAHAYYAAPRAVASPPSNLTVRGDLWTKDVNLATLSSPAGRGTPVIQQATTGSMDDPTSTKQPVSSATGDVVEAFALSAKQYWHTGSNGSGLSLPSEPVTSLTATPTAGGVGLTVSFNDTTPGTGVSSKRLWDLGDGTVSTLQTFTHTYPNLGTYPVRLTNYNNGGASVAGVVVSVVAPPIAAFKAAQSISGTALTVSFADLSVGGPTSWTWNFGDGKSAAVQNPVHTYAKAGTYIVTLTARNAAGPSVSQLTLVVKPANLVVIAGKPGRVTNVTVTRFPRRTILIGYRPAVANGAPILRYVAVCRSSNGGVARSGVVVRGRIPVTRLTYGKLYRCYVYAVNRVGNGPPSQVTGVIVPRR